MPLLAALVGFVALQGGWKPYTLRPGIRVDLPTPPVEQPREPDAPTVTNWVSDHQITNIIVITHGTYKDDGTPLDQYLNGMLFGLLEEGKGKVVAQKDILLNGWPGIEYRIQSADGTYSMGRTYAMPDQFASTTLFGGSARKIEAPATKVFASFKLPSKVGQGPFKTAGPQFKAYPIGETGVSFELPNPPSHSTHEIPGPHKRKMHQYLASYVNRIFSVGYTEFEEDEIASMSAEDIAQALREMHLHLAVGFDAKGLQAVAGKFAGREAFRSTYPVPKIFSYARVQTVMIGRRVFFAFALTPPLLAKSPEVERFFGSIKIE